MSEDMVESVMLGSVASQYYLSYMTVSMFGSNIGPDTSLEVRLNFSFLLSSIVLTSSFQISFLLIIQNDYGYIFVCGGFSACLIRCFRI